MVSIEALEMEIKYIKEWMDELKQWQEKILDMLNNLDERYPTRREFNAVKWVIWILWGVLWITTAILSFM